MKNILQKFFPASSNNSTLKALQEQFLGNSGDQMKTVENSVQMLMLDSHEVLLELLTEIPFLSYMLKVLSAEEQDGTTPGCHLLFGGVWHASQQWGGGADLATS